MFDKEFLIKKVGK